MDENGVQLIPSTTKKNKNKQIHTPFTVFVYDTHAKNLQLDKYTMSTMEMQR